MKKKALIVMFGFLFGICGSLCFVDSVPQGTFATSSSVSVWDGVVPDDEADFEPGGWFYDAGKSEYYINSAAGFAYFSHLVTSGSNSFSNSTILLGTDIDLAGNDWAPIGSGTHPFNGQFDGNGHYIFNGHIVSDGIEHLGLFGKIGQGGALKNLNLRNMNVQGENATYVGILVGEMTSSTGGAKTDNCSVKGEIQVSTTSQCYVGGIAGKISGVDVTNSMADISISATAGSNAGVGGLVGQIENGKIEFSYFAGSIRANAGYVGGIAGRVIGNCTVANAYNAGKMDLSSTASGNLGGLIGRNEGVLSLESVYAAAAWTSPSSLNSSYVSGLVGYAPSSATIDLKNALFISNGGDEFSSLSQNVHPLYQSDIGARVSAQSTYFDASLSATWQNQQGATENLDLLARTREFYRNVQFFAEQAWTFDAGELGWKIGTGNLPCFNFVPGSMQDEYATGDNDFDTSSGSTQLRGHGTIKSPYLIETAGDLGLLSDLVNEGAFVPDVDDNLAYFSLQNDIDMIGKSWVPIGNFQHPFSGVFDGNGHTISSIRCLSEDGFEFHGLFGNVSGAVIKNLSVKDFAFEGADPAVAATGNIAANVSSNTYLVNCVDKNSSQNSVGKISGGTLYVFLGKNNTSDLSGSHIAIDLKTLRLSGMHYECGLDIYISGEGGNFFSKSATAENLMSGLYFGEYHLLVSESGRVLQEIDPTFADATFGQTLLPNRSTSLGEKDVLIRRGYKLQGYRSGGELLYSSDRNAWTNAFSSLDKANLVSGLTAQWQESSQTVRVVYNGYEKANFAATKNTAAQYVGKTVLGSDGQPATDNSGHAPQVLLDENGQVYVDYQLKYDSFLSENPFVFQVPYFQNETVTQKLRGEDFDLAGIYSIGSHAGEGFAFDKPLDSNSFALINDNFGDTFYAKWQGTNEENHSVRIEFEGENSQVNIADAVESVKMLGYSKGEGTAFVVDQQKESVMQTDGTKAFFTLQYNTLHSDLADNFLSFEVALANGYTLDLDGIQFDGGSFDESSYDTNFGTPKTSVDTFEDVFSVEIFNNLKFFNLLGDHVISFTIARQTYTDKLTLSSGEIFVGVGPSEKVTLSADGVGFSSNLRIGNSVHDAVDLVQFVALHKTEASLTYDWQGLFDWLQGEEEGLYVSFDLIHNQIIFSSGKYDAVQVDLSSFSHGLYLSIVGTEFTISKSTSGRYEEITLCNLSRAVDEVKLSYDTSSPSSSQISYQAFNSFVILLSTEFENRTGADSVSFSSVGPQNYDDTAIGVVSGKSLKKFAGDGASSDNSTKYMVQFASGWHNVTGRERINAVTEYVRAALNFNFVHENDLDADTRTMFVNGQNEEPRIVWQSGTEVDVNEAGQIKLYIQNSDRFRFFEDRTGTSELKLYSTSSTSNFNVRVSVFEESLKDKTGNFVQILNNDNATYFSGSVESISKGTSVMLDTDPYVFENDGVLLTLNFNQFEDNHLRAAEYAVTLVCTDELYEVQYGTKFISLQELQADPNMETLVQEFCSASDEPHEESASDVSTTASTQTNSNEANSGIMTSVKFDDTLSLHTNLGSDGGYIFHRWIVRSEESNRIYSAADLNEAFEDIYQQSAQPDEQNVLHAFAVYLRKQSTISIAQRVKIEDETISLTEAARRGIDLQLQNAKVAQDHQVQYVYSGAKDVDAATLLLSGQNSNGYYLSGYMAVDQDGRELLHGDERIYTPYDPDLDESATTKKITLDLSWLKNAMQDGRLLNGNVREENFFIVPILTRKTLSITFHSGTQAGSEFGDSLGGEVFSSTGEKTTDLTYQYGQVVGQTLKFGDVLNLADILPYRDGSMQDVSVEDLFRSRIGYRLESPYWAWKSTSSEGTVALSNLSISVEMFEDQTIAAQIDVYRLWQSISVAVTFHSNGGQFETTPYSQQTVQFQYDHVYDSSQMASLLLGGKVYPISKIGHTLTGWTLFANGGTKIFNADGSVSEDATGYFEGEKFVQTESFVVYAQWEANEYQIEILFNQADSVLGQTDGTASATYSIIYGSQLSSLEISSGVFGIDSFTAQRAGFIFDGVYAVTDDGKQKVSNIFVFNSSFPSFHLPQNAGEVATTLCFGWQFDEDYFALSVNNSLSPLIYTEEGHLVQLAAYFLEGNYSAKHFVIDTNAASLITLSPEVKTIGMQMLLSSDSGAVISPDQKSFRVGDVGTYSLTLDLTLTENITNNPLIDHNFNLGELTTISLTLVIRVLPNTSLELEISDYDALRLENLKRLVGVFLSNTSSSGMSLRQSVYASSTLKQALTALLSLDNTASGQEDQEIYEYFMTRFYLYVHTPEDTFQNAALARTYYKDWKYSDYQTFKTEQQERYLQILSRIDFFGFYDFENETDSFVLNGYSASGDGQNYANFVELHSENGPVTRIRVSRLEIVSAMSTLQAGNEYTLRAYIAGDDVDNYDLPVSSLGESYLDVTEMSGYIFPQIIVLDNTSEQKQTYYSSDYALAGSRDVEWKGVGTPTEIGDAQFYLLGKMNGSNVYVNVQICTSNIGSAETDTTFRFTDATNYLYFSNVTAMLERSEQERSRCTSNFKFVLDDSDFFIIRNIKNVARVHVDAAMLTTENDILSFGLIDDSILEISQVKYVGGSTSASQMVDGESFTANGTLIFDIIHNNAGSVEILVNDTVQEIVFALKTLKVGDFASLYTWSTTKVTTLSGKMENKDSLSVTKEEIEKACEESTLELAEINYYAIFTDLVKVTYDFNFPPEFDGRGSQTSQIKLGEELTDELMPYVSGLGNATSLYVKERNGSLVNYTTLNNTSVDGKMVFGGWNNTTDGAGNVYRFTPITFVPKWTIPEISYTARFGEEEHFAVFSINSFNFNDFVILQDTNDSIFEYDYRWEISFDDGSREEHSGQSIDLKEGGSTAASGTYTLKVTRRLRSIFVAAGTFEGETQSGPIVITSHVLFMQYKLLEITVPENPTAQYDGTDHKYDENFFFKLKYVEYDNSTGEYASEVYEETLTYVQTGLATFSILFNRDSVTSVVNVGSYEVTLNLLANAFTFGNGLSEANLKFTYTVTPLVFGVDDVTFAMQKRFNEKDPDLRQSVRVADGLFVTVLLRRDGDEDVGVKNLYIDGVAGQVNNNVDFTLNGVKVFEDGHAVGNAPVGTFTILPSDNLQINLSGTALSENKVQAPYNGKEYTLKVEEFKLLIQNAEQDTITLDISLFDANMNQDLTGSDNLKFLRDKMSSLSASFFTSEVVTAINAGIYYFNFNVAGTELEKYYTSVTISGIYRFEITPLAITLGGLNLDKDYDGLSTNLLDLPGRSDIQVEANYASPFAGPTSVTLTLVPKAGSDVNISNYALENRVAPATIRKLKATLTFGLKDAVDLGDDGMGYYYGTLREDNLASYLTISKITSAKDNKDIDLDLMLRSDRYALNFLGWRTNSHGYILAQNWTISEIAEPGNIQNQSTFADFEMTCNDFTFKIAARPETLNIPENFKTITVGETFEKLEYQYILSATGDEFTLELGVKNHAGAFSLGQYDLEVLNDDYASAINGSVIITTQPGNKGLNVVEKTGLVILTITEGEITSQEYDGSTYTISTSAMTFTISNGSGKDITYHLTAMLNEEPYNEELHFAVAFDRVSARNAGKYRLIVSESLDSFNYAFAEDYTFEITKRTIHAANLKGKFDKEYDGTLLTNQVTEFDEKVSGDDVFLSGTFNSFEPAADILVTLSEPGGREGGNYQFDNNQTTSSILKIKAKIVFAGGEQTPEFEYGSLSKSTLLEQLGVIVTADSPLAASDYKLQISSTISDSDYTERGFLKVNEYQITISDENASNPYGHYEISPLAVTIKVTPYKLTLVLSEIIKTMEYGDEEWQKLFADGGKFECQIPAALNPLSEMVLVKLTAVGITQTRDVKTYRISSKAGDFESLDPNYELIAVTDNTKDGAFAIVKPNSRLYVLLDNDAESDLDRVSIVTEYDGKEYDQILLLQQDGQWWLKLRNSSTSQEKLLAKLAFFTLSGTDYVRYDGEVVGLQAQFNISQNVHYVTEKNAIYITVSGASATSNQVKFGLNVPASPLFDFGLTVQPKKLYFNTPYIQKTFNNQDAIYEYADARELLDGIVEGEALSLTIRFVDALGTVMKYFSPTYYTVAGTLSGATANQYQVVSKFASDDGDAVEGRIARAEVSVFVTPKHVTYGQDEALLAHSLNAFAEGTDYRFDFGSLGNFDIEAYTNSGRDFNFSMHIVSTAADLSTTGHLKVGDYCGVVTLETTDKTDFRLTVYVSGFVEAETTTSAIVTIEKRVLTLAQKEGGQPLQEIFTRDYDETLVAKIFDVEGDNSLNNLLFALEGIVSRDAITDDVKLSHAEFSDYRGVGLLVTFFFDETCKDWENYDVEEYPSGVINSVRIGLEFDLGHDGVTTNVIGKMIDALAYPLDFSAYLTSNAFDPTTNQLINFPSMLGGYAGHSFSHWALILTLSEQSAKKQTQLEELVALQSSLSLDIEEDLLQSDVKTATITVGNNADTVALLRELLKDDTFDMWYKNEPAPKIVFHAKWDVQKFSLTVKIADENGNISDAGFGRVTSEGFEGTVTGEDTFEDIFSYGEDDEILLQANADTHAQFVAFYLENREIHGMDVVDGVGNFTAQRFDDYATLQIENIVHDIVIVVRFRPQKVTINLQVDDADKSLLQIEGDQFDDNFVWQTNYFEVQGKSLADLPQISLIGRTLRAFKIDGEEILAENFAGKKLVDDAQTEDVTLEIQLLFDAKQVPILVDLGYGEPYTIYVTYGNTYSSATYIDGRDAWVETPERSGYKFLNWTVGDQVVTGEDSVLSEEVTLVANWQQLAFEIEIVLENVTAVSHSGLLLEGNKLTASDVAFGTSFTLLIVANKGFSLPEAESELWDERFVVQMDASGQAQLTFDVQNANFLATISAVAGQNLIKFSGENVKQVQVFDTTDDKQEITDIAVHGEESSFHLNSGRVVRFEVTPLEGFAMSSVVTFKDDSGSVLDAAALQRMGIDILLQELDQGMLVLELSGITDSIYLQFQAAAGLNEVAIGFSDYAAIERVTVGTSEYASPSDVITLSLTTGQELSLMVTFAHGFDLDRLDISDAFAPTAAHIKQTSKLSEYTYSFVLENICSDVDVQVVSKFHQYTVTFSVTTYDKQGNKISEPQNTLKAVLGESEYDATLTADFGTIIELRITNAAGYSLGGWDVRDGNLSLEDNLLEEYGFEYVNGGWTYRISGDVTVWAIFSESDYEITLHTLDYANTDSSISNIEERNRMIEIAGQYFNSQDEAITEISIAFGQERTIKFAVPDGYMFGGYGFYEAATFHFLSTEIRQDDMVEVRIRSELFGATAVDKLYMLVISKPTSVLVTSKVTFGDDQVDDVDVGGAALSSASGEAANAWGYIDGSRVHYLDGDYAGGMPTNQHAFRFVAYNQVNGNARDEIFLKVNAPRKGYHFERLEFVNAELGYEEVPQTLEDGSRIFKISGMKGGLEDVEILVLYASDINIVDIAFVHEGDVANGGLIEVEQKDADIKKLWTSGNGYSSITVSVFTDVGFFASVYLHAGFAIDAENPASSVEDLSNLIVAGSVEYQALPVGDTGFTGVITFEVLPCFGLNEIFINVNNEKVIVVFRDDEKVLARVHNVGYGTELQSHLREDNRDNIESDLSFQNGMLNLVRTSDDYHFEGYFTYQNGAGKRYVGSDGIAMGIWEENGYEYNIATGKYELQQNAFINENGEIEISLYLYMSYYKTRISITFVPGVSGSLTAQDIVGGVDTTNSWFYELQPYNIEVAFNTDVTFIAPEINGYKFYKFVIRQTSFDGVDISPVVFYQNEMPWSTNEVDRIVECRVEIVYFASLDVSIIGGEGKVELTQQFDDSHAEALIAEGYFDTTKSFFVKALPDEGYTFERWRFLGEEYRTEEIAISYSRRANIELYLQGKPVTLDLSDYDPTHGQIVSMRIVGISGSPSKDVENLVINVGGKYEKTTQSIEVRVGDTITFALSIEKDFSVRWNRDDISFAEQRNGLSYFTLKIIGSFGLTTQKIIPIFSASQRSVYFFKNFDADQFWANALDDNNPSMAVVTSVASLPGEFFTIERGNDVEIEVAVTAKYAISSMRLVSGGVTLTDMTQFFDGSKIVLPEEFMEEQDFAGDIYITIQVRRLLWEELNLQGHRLSGAGTKGNPYHISSVEDLVLFMQLSNSGAVDARGTAYYAAQYILDTDLDLSERFWTPIGTLTFPFDGAFNFNNHLVTGINLALLYEEVNYGGLFGVLGPNARISRGNISWWWIVLIVVLVVLLMLILIMLIYRNKKRKEVHDQLATR